MSLKNKTQNFLEIYVSFILTRNVYQLLLLRDAQRYEIKRSAVKNLYIDACIKSRIYTQEFANILKSQPPLQEDEEYVSYDVESLFTNVPIKVTIDFILEEIYTNKKLKPLCSKLIFKRLLLKLSTESTFIFQTKLYKQTDGCTMGGPLSVTFFKHIFNETGTRPSQTPKSKIV